MTDVNFWLMNHVLVIAMDFENQLNSVHTFRYQQSIYNKGQLAPFLIAKYAICFN